MTHLARSLLVLAGLTGLALLAPAAAIAQTPAAAPISDPQLLRSAVLLTLLAIVPAIFISMTSFIRIAVVLAMVRHAFGMPETPPNAVLISLAVFLTAFVMAPTFGAINTTALQPLLAGTIDVDAALAKGGAPLRDFMLAQVRDEDIAAVYALAKAPLPATPEGVDILKLAPAFILNELRISFTIGFVILLPFLLIEIVVASILLSLGMMMVPPATISLPIKLLMFVIIDGWALVIQGVLGGFR
jgi:flagellar biosynthesis protein FliP